MLALWVKHRVEFPIGGEGVPHGFKVLFGCVDVQRESATQGGRGWRRCGGMNAGTQTGKEIRREIHLPCGTRGYLVGISLVISRCRGFDRWWLIFRLCVMIGRGKRHVENVRCAHLQSMPYAVHASL